MLGSGGERAQVVAAGPTRAHGWVGGPAVGPLPVGRSRVPDPTRHIDLYDLLQDEAAAVTTRIRARPQKPAQPDGEHFEEGYRHLREATDTLLLLLVTGVFFDRDRTHTRLWIQTIQQLMRARQVVTGVFNHYWDALQHYPALLVLRAAGLAALLTDREDVLLRLFKDPAWTDPLRGATLPAVQALHDYRVLDGGIIKSFPRWAGTRWSYPESHLLREELREPMRQFEPDDAAYQRLVDGYEYRVALTQYCLSQERYGPAAGEFIGELQWGRDGSLTPADNFKASADMAMWSGALGLDSVAALEHKMEELREELKGSRRQG
jgi:hypothetical protein